MQILGLHIIPGTFKAADLTDGLEVETLAGMPLTVTLADGKVTFTAPDMGVAAMVTEADVMACGNVLHKVDSVLVPGIPEVKEAMPPAAPKEEEAPMPVAPAPEQVAITTPAFPEPPETTPEAPVPADGGVLRPSALHLALCTPCTHEAQSKSFLQDVAPKGEATSVPLQCSIFKRTS